MGENIITCMALFTNYQLQKAQCENKLDQKKEIRFSFGSDQTSGASGVNTARFRTQDDLEVLEPLGFLSGSVEVCYCLNSNVVTTCR